ncbi:MAG: hypothetical protein J0H39_06455 [Alphaproteobacteria bacterium]|nr:hypothetical protein [Alphaproteobacteria bacterium]
MNRLVRGAIGILALSSMLTGCGHLGKSMIEGEFYSEKPFVPAGTITVLPPKLDRVDLFSHIARGDYCVHYKIITGYEHPLAKAARTQHTPPPTQSTTPQQTPASTAPTKTASFGWILSAFIPAAAAENEKPQPAAGEKVVPAPPPTANRGADTNRVAEACRDDINRLASTSNETNYSVSQRLARAYDEFARGSADGTTPTTTELRYRRNEIQDEVIRASEQRCNAYKLYLQTVQSNASFLSGSASTILGGLGAIFTDSGVSRALAGAAGISAGVGAQFQDSFFMSLAVPAISEGIDNARQTIFKQIRQQRDSDINGYTLQHALLDAVRYDGSCSIPRGLQEVADAARNVRNPSAFVMQRAIDQFAMARQSLNDLTRTEGGDFPSGGIIGPPIDRDSPSSLLALVNQSPLKAIQAQIDNVNTQEQNTDIRLSRFLAAAATEDVGTLEPAVAIVRKELAAARDRTTAAINTDEIKKSAQEIDVKLRGARRSYADARDDAAKRDIAFAEINVQSGEAQSKVLAEIEKAALPFFSAVIASRASSGAISKDQKIQYLCRVHALFVAVHKAEQEPEAPAACKKP